MRMELVAFPLSLYSIIYHVIRLILYIVIFGCGGAAVG